MKKPKSEQSKLKPVNINYLLIGGVALFIIVAASIVIYTNRTTEAERARLTNSANQSAYDGDFTKTIEIRTKLYQKTSDLERKAEIANEIASSYYALNDIQNAQVWVVKSTNDFTKAGMTDQAANVKQDSAMQIQQIKDLQNSSKKQGTGANSALE